MATPKQNYARQYQAYAQSIEPDIPSSVRTYSIFNPDTGTWQRMTNNFRSPIPAQGQVVVPVQPMTPAQEQAAVNLALAQARATQGKDYTPRQTSTRTRSRGSRKVSQPLLREEAVPMQRQPVAEAMMLTGPSTDASSINLNPNLNYNFRSGYENFQQEIPRSNVYGPLQNPRTVRSMSPDYQEVNTPVVPVDLAAKIVPTIAAANTKIAVPAKQAQPSTTVVKPLPAVAKASHDVLSNIEIDPADMRDNDNDTIYDPNAPSMYTAGTPEEHAEFKRKLGNFLEGATTVALLGAPAVPYFGARMAASPLGVAVGKSVARLGKGFKAGAEAAWKNYKNALTLGENPAATVATTQARTGFLNPELQATYNARNGIPFGFFTR